MSKNLYANPEISWHPSSDGLSIRWAEDDHCYLSGDLLRRACRCASCADAQSKDQFAPGNGVRVSKVRSLGAAGVQFEFSDKHGLWVYSWSYLRELTQGG